MQNLRQSLGLLRPLSVVCEDPVRELCIPTLARHATGGASVNNVGSVDVGSHMVNRLRGLSP